VTADPFTAWLSDALDAVETMAKAAEKDAGSPWRTQGGLVVHSGPVDRYEKHDGLWDSEGCTEPWHRLCMTQPVADHVAAFDPEFVHGLVAAHRELLKLHACTTNAPGGMAACVSCGTHDEYPTDWPCPTLRVVGAFWARLHPEGWREEWRPE
jgi:Family of unknown function (DUF6221)